MWLKIKDYPYWVSKDGRVYSIKSKRCLRPSNRRGYASVLLSKDSKTKRFNIHRLVASTFLFRPSNDLVVNHIDGDKWNNHISNLEWVTPGENTKHAFRTGLHSMPYKLTGR